jgi:BirA family biotin operon repressor/biotin-[acetyl-CoA-carboxylase] ligase
MAELFRSAGAPVIELKTVASTNEEALARAKAGERGPLWIVAERQSAGRGRRGRPWVSEPGNLYASLLVADAAPASVVSGICFVAALALHDALLDAAHGLAPAQLKLKWPNDVLLDGRKLAGILVEGLSLAGGHTAAVVGFGVNCRHHPEAAEYPATDLATRGYAVEPRALLAVLAGTMAARLQEWRRGDGFAGIRAAWLARASGVGGPIEVRLPDRKIAGTFEAIDQHGALVLKRGDGARETIAAGDVFPQMTG